MGSLYDPQTASEFLNSLLDVFFLNFSVWYLGYLSAPERLNTGFASKLASVDLRLRLFAGAALGVMTVYFLMMEK